ncbi:hypothetical protein T439DRAFT_325245 [Meredithblackwellia eburnea MCA 4105]
MEGSSWNSKRQLTIVGIFSFVSLLLVSTSLWEHSGTTGSLQPKTSYAQAKGFSIESIDISDHNQSLPYPVAMSLSLTDAQCDAAFPLFWGQLEVMKRIQLEDGGVSEWMVDFPDLVRVAWIDGELYVKRFYQSWMSRNYAVLAGMHDALISAPEPVPNFELAFNTGDKGPPGALWGLARERWARPTWMLADFGFHSWPEVALTDYKGVRREIERVERGLNWKDKIPKLFWRGVFMSEPRVKLRDLTNGKPWADIGEIIWWKKGQGRHTLWDHCKYKYLAHTEGGGGAYSGRLKYLLNCRSIAIAHELNSEQHFHTAFDTDPNSPNQNMIMLSGGSSWDGLEETITKLEEDPERAETIADNAWRTLHGRYLTPAATACYWRKALKAYASTMKYEPQIGGKDYASFSLMGTLDWDPHRK